LFGQLQDRRQPTSRLRLPAPGSFPTSGAGS
jgi:hypothetical protein